MKKILAMLVMLSLVFGMLAAQDGELTFKGGLWTGFRVQAGNEYDTDYVPAHEKDKAYIDAYNDDQGRKGGLQAQIQADYVTENSGASVRLRVRSDHVTDGIGSLVNDGHAYGWVKFLPEGIAELSGGLLNNNKWGNYTRFYLDGNLDNRNYLKLAITPIEGLSFGVNLLNWKAASGTYQLGHAFSGTVIGAEYKVPDTFGIRLAAVILEKDALDVNGFSAGSSAARQGLRGGSYYFWHAGDYTLAQDALGPGTPPVDIPYAFDADFGLLFSGFYTGMENLRLDFEGGFATGKYIPFMSADEETWSSLGIAVMGDYSINEQLTAGLRALFETAPAKEKNLAALEIRPQASYALNDWLTLGLQIPIALVGKKEGLDKATTIIGVKPSAEFKLNDTTSITAFYKLAATTPDGGDTGIHHTVQVDLIWTF